MTDPDRICSKRTSPRVARLLGLALLAWAGLAAAGIAQAAGSSGSQPHLYSAATPVPDQSAATRAKAFKRDLAQVLVKVSGNPNAAQVSALAPVLDNAGNLVVEYRYRTLPVSAGGGQELWAHFDQKAVDKALAQSGQSTWGKGRPTVVTWVLNSGTIVADNPNDPVVVSMRKSAGKRGLPLVVPLMDLTDQKQVSAFDIRTLFLPALKSASSRYGAHAMLVGVINQADVGVQSQWNLVFGQDTVPFQEHAQTPQQAAARAVARSATLLAQKLAYLPSIGAAGRVHVVVWGIGSLADLKQVEALISGVPGVNAARLDALRGNRARFSVPYAGAASDLAQALTVAGPLTRVRAPTTAMVPAASSAAAALPELDFRYKP